LKGGEHRELKSKGFSRGVLRSPKTRLELFGIKALWVETTDFERDWMDERKVVQWWMGEP